MFVIIFFSRFLAFVVQEVGRASNVLPCTWACVLQSGHVKKDSDSSLMDVLLPMICLITMI